MHHIIPNQTIFLLFLVPKLRNPFMHHIIPNQTIFLLFLFYALFFGIFLPLGHSFGFWNRFLSGKYKGWWRKFRCDSILNPLSLQVPDCIEEQLCVITCKGQEDIGFT